MNKIHLIAGLPRAGSTLFCQIINSNPNFHATPTSGVLDMLKGMRSIFSQNPTWRAQNRLEIYENFRQGLNGFLEGYFYDANVVFDKNRGWTNNIMLLDTIRQNQDAKLIWLYRDPAEIISSIEYQYQKTFLLENMDESAAPGAFSTLDRRIGTYASADGIISGPVESLKDALEMGYANRILFIKYYELTNYPKEVMDAVHDFIGEPHYEYDFTKIKQTTYEWDGLYNYKFLHTIREGEIKYKKGDFQLEPKFLQAIYDRFSPLNKFILNNDPQELLNIKINPDDNLNQTDEQHKKAVENIILDDDNKQTSNPFYIERL